MNTILTAGNKFPDTPYEFCSLMEGKMVVFQNNYYHGYLAWANLNFLPSLDLKYFDYLKWKERFILFHLIPSYEIQLVKIRYNVLIFNDLV